MPPTTDHKPTDHRSTDHHSAGHDSTGLLTAEALDAAAPALAGLLIDAVRAGASVGFPADLTDEAATAWWRARVDAVAAGALSVPPAGPAGAPLGTVSLALEQYPNGAHRAEIGKLLVHSTARRRGLGRTLLALAERAAAERGRTLLLLDTETDSDAELLYRSSGWTALGTVPGYAADPAGTLRPSTFFYKHLDAAEHPGTSDAAATTTAAGTSTAAAARPS
ncbi:GNAT family N-acetyltransferase [Kitasatospora arboriphila]|uniref:N-acetyltransferase domain-containing protein n=1 Tax=Kitasatospora arboriphila TaxID=258052 RepID=A0ABN1THU1_9ACTN